MKFSLVLQHVRQACDELHESQVGTGTIARIPRKALQAFLADWEHLDRLAGDGDRRHDDEIED